MYNTVAQKRKREHFYTLPVKAELDQMREGLSLFNVHKLVTTYPAKMEKLFVLSGPPVQLRLVDFLLLIEYNYSASGSNQREKEERTTVHWSGSSLYPMASTCALEMFLPTCWASYEEFKSGMIKGIVSGFGFGQV